MRWPFLVSLVFHAGGIVALCVARSGKGEPPRPATIVCMRVEESSAAPDIPKPVELPEVEAEAAAAPIEAEPEAPEPEPIDFRAVETHDPSPTPLPVPRLARITPLRRAAPVAVAPTPTPPAPVARTTASRATCAVPKGDRCRPPDYPKAAQRQGIEGRVLLRVLVGRDGAVVTVEVEESSGSETLDNAAIAAVREWTFDPASDGSEPVESFVRVPFRFRLHA